jgi:aspartate/methionine/tyrosine aminotransferase
VFAERLLRSKKVLVLPGDLFGPSGPAHVRLSYATEDGRLREGLGRLAEFLRELRGTGAGEGRRAA